MSSIRTGLSCNIVDGQLQILSDGSRWTVPRGIIERSPILVDTLQSTENAGCDYLVAPAGYLESYLTHVSGRTRQAATNRRYASNGSLTRYFQAADYFADEAAMQELCRLLGSRLFEECQKNCGASLEMREEKTRTDNKTMSSSMKNFNAMQILKQLPSHLLEYVIRASPASLDDKLSALPSTVHHLAILATFPSITTDRSIVIDAKQYSARTLACTFRAIASQPRVQRLRVSNLHLDRDGKVLEYFTAFISCHSSLQELAITDWTHSPAAVQAICAAVSGHTGIQTLELAQCDISTETAKPIAEAISHLQGLRHLTIRQDKVTSRRHSAALLTPVLSQLPHLSHLDLGNNPLSADDTKTLSSSLYHLPNLEHLNLCACYMKHEGGKALAPALAGLSRITALKFANNMLQCAGIEALVPAIASLPNLQHLDLRRNAICVAGVRALCCVLPGLTKLQRLYLGSNSIGSAGASLLAPALLNLSRLLDLDMSYNRVRNDGVVGLMTGVANLTALRHLNLAGDAVGRDAMVGMVAPAIAHLHQLNYLDLELASSCPLKECAQSLSAALLGTPQLTSLRLGVGAITNTPASILAPALGSLHELECLELTYSTITELGAVGLAKGLGLLTAATKLVLQQSCARATGAPEALGAADRTAALAPAIAHLTSLQHLCMEGLNMTVEGAQEIANTLFDLGELRVLLLSSNTICDDGLQALAEPISCLLELERLELTDCRIGDRGAMSLASSLAACSKIRWVELNSNSIGDRGALALANALSGNRCVERLDIRCNEVVNTDVPFLQQPWILGDDYHACEV